MITLRMLLNLLLIGSISQSEVFGMEGKTRTSRTFFQRAVLDGIQELDEESDPDAMVPVAEAKEGKRFALANLKQGSRMTRIPLPIYLYSLVRKVCLNDLVAEQIVAKLKEISTLNQVVDDLFFQQVSAILVAHKDLDSVVHAICMYLVSSHK